MRLAALALLAALAWAADTPTTATPLRWQAGRTTLADAIGRLVGSGNRVWLAEGVDDAVEADVPAVDGTWWDGVAAVCQAFTLRPDEGEPSDEQLDLPGQPVPVGHGTLVLSRGRPPGMQTAGNLLACAEGGGAVRLWLRAEPRIARGRLAWARAEPPAIEQAPSIGLQAAESVESAPPAATWRPAAAIPADARLAVTVQTASVARWTVRCPLAVGATVRPQVGGQAIAAVLVVDPAVTTWEGQSLPERRPLVAMTGPAALLQRLQVRLRQGEAELGTRGGGIRSGDGDVRVLYRYLRAAPEGAIELEIEGSSQEAVQRLPLRLPLPVQARASTAIPAEAAARLAWEAGERPLSQWLGLLAATGNPVLPEVGVDTAARLALPAVQGSFWNGILAVGATTGLAPAPPAKGALAGGAVRLIRRTQLAAAACGPLLLDAERVDAGKGELLFRLRAILEPRLPEDGYAAPTYAWASWASDDQGRMHEVVASETGSRQPQAQMVLGLVDEERVDPLPEVLVRLSAPGARRIELTGLATLPRLRLWRTSADLAVNEPAEVLLGARAVELTALGAPTRIGTSQLGPGLLLRGLHDAYSMTTVSGRLPPLDVARGLMW